jgi:hypothetical protein
MENRFFVVMRDNAMEGGRNRSIEGHYQRNCFACEALRWLLITFFVRGASESVGRFPVVCQIIETEVLLRGELPHEKLVVFVCQKFDLDI